MRDDRIDDQFRNLITSRPLKFCKNALFSADAPAANQVPADVVSSVAGNKSTVVADGRNDKTFQE